MDVVNGGLDRWWSVIVQMALVGSGLDRWWSTMVQMEVVNGSSDKWWFRSVEVSDVVQIGDGLDWWLFRSVVVGNGSDRRWPAVTQIDISWRWFRSMVVHGGDRSWFRSMGDQIVGGLDS
ncbi:uncharacterized protein LOC112501462 [Cynara cardunculus var. scolymus]|uniref:uncharacterized protein LOC112501462 n=1 Tax=Cynara cardunculus var. scolymus TaxID=59895 RepID=UPI000D62FB18|nr:uncharacterized protein LOC112501462 [Cynara cardunculus var. scolymus]